MRDDDTLVVHQRAGDLWEMCLESTDHPVLRFERVENGVVIIRRLADRRTVARVRPDGSVSRSFEVDRNYLVRMVHLVTTGDHERACRMGRAFVVRFRRAIFTDSLVA